MRRVSDLFRGSAANLFASGLASLSALASVPWLARSFGWDRLGLMLLAWGLVGFCSVLDFGVTRSLIRRLSSAGSSGESAGGGYASALILLLVAGGVGGVAVVGLVELWIAGRTWESVQVAAEAREALKWLGLLVPLSVLSVGARAPLDADRRFGVSAALRAIPPVAGFPLPLLLPASCRSLSSVLWLWCGLHAVSFALAWVLSLRLSGRISRGGPRAGTVRELLSEGGWILISSVISPFLALGDRYAMTLGTALPLMAGYAVAHDLAVRILVIPKAICAALLPLAAVGGRNSDGEASDLVPRAMRWVVLSVGTALVGLLPFARELVLAWLGSDTAPRVLPILYILCAGVMLNAVAHVPVIALQAAGRARSVALAHVAEACVYGASLLGAVKLGGVEAFAWTYLALQAGDLLILLVILSRVRGRQGLCGPAVMAAGISALAVGLALCPMSTNARILLGLGAMTGFLALMATTVAREDFSALRRALRGSAA